MHRVHPHPVPLPRLGLLLELLHVILEGLGDHPGMGIPYEAVEDRPHRRPVLYRELRDPLALPELLHMVEVEGLRDVLRDVVDRGGVPLDSHVILRERVDVDEPDLPDRADGVPVVEVLQSAENAARVGVGWIRTEGVALPVEFDFQGLVQMQQDMDRRVAGDRRLLDDHLGVASLEGLLQTGEKPGYALALERYEEVGLVAGHDLVIDGQRHEEKMRVQSIGPLLGDSRLLQNPVEPLLLDRLSERVLGVPPTGHRAGGMLAGVEVGEEVVVFRIDVLDEVRKKGIGIDLPGEDVLLQLLPMGIVEDAQGEHPLRFAMPIAEEVSNPSASRLPVTGINRIYAGIRRDLSPGNRAP